jgi:arylsulfatase A-like enzyme
MQGRGDKSPLIAPKRLTIGKVLQQAGYETACIGKWHLGFAVEDLAGIHKGGPVDRGFDRYFGIPRSLDIPPYYYIRDRRAVAPPTGKVAASSSPGVTPIQGAFWRAGGIAPGFKHIDVLPRFADEAVAYLEAPARTKKPFFLYLALPSPHTPWLPGKEFQGKTSIGDYGDYTAQVDDVVGRVLAALERHKRAGNTLVVVTSDNGPVWYPHDVEKLKHDSVGGLRGMKGDAYEGGHRMPFVVRWPGQIQPGSVSKELICHTDMLATFAAMVGTELPAGEGLDSQNILPALRGAQMKKPIHETLILQSSRGYLAVRKGPWKLIPGLGSGGFTKPSRVKPEPGGPKGQLYNLAKDRAETKNLWLEKPEIVAELTAVLERERAKGSR